MLLFRKSTMQDIDTLMSIIDSGKKLLLNRGIDQWQKGSPSREQLVEDVDKGVSYAAVSEGRIVGTCMIMSDEEVSYRTLLGGAWLTAPDSGYLTVHRCAVAPDSRGQGVIGFLFSHAIEMARSSGAPSVRVDTHPDNIAMQHALNKAGFTRCGNITLVGGAENGGPRVGYEIRV